MGEWTTDKYRATVHDDGLLEVFPFEKPKLSITEFRDGKATQSLVGMDEASPSEKELLACLSRMPVLAATYDGEEGWWCDLDAGFQRYKCWKSKKDFVGIMRRDLGFAHDEVVEIFHECKEYEWSYCPRQG